MFFEFARAVKEIEPKVFLGENVRGLLTHDNGKTLETIKSVIKELGYTLIEPRILQAIFYRMPKKKNGYLLPITLINFYFFDNRMAIVTHSK